MAADVSDAELLAGWTEDGLMEAARAEGYADAASSSSIEGAQAATPNPIASFSFGGNGNGGAPPTVEQLTIKNAAAAQLDFRIVHDERPKHTFATSGMRCILEMRHRRA